jgi:toxin ParE1/3/4
MPRKVTFRPVAKDDLQNIFRYISNDSPERAIAYVRRLHERCETLADFPELGRQRDDLALGLRILAFERSAVIAYRLGGDAVQIVNVFYRGRDYEVLLKEISEDPV